VRYSAYVAIAVTACAKPQPLHYSHPTANQQTYLQDRYACLQQAQQGRSGTYVNAYGLAKTAPFTSTASSRAPNLYKSPSKASS